MTATRCCAYVTLAASFLLILSSPLLFQTDSKVRSKALNPTATGSASPTQDVPKEILKVTINASRVSVTRDASYGVYADLENISSDVVRLRPQETMLVVQPEIAQPTACVGLEPGIFPAQPLSTDKAQSDGISIQPNEHYKVFWELTDDLAVPPKDRQSTCSYDWKKWIDEYLGFVPGEYAFTVEGVVYAPNAKSELIAHTYTETTTLHVGLSQASTALAAFIGALLAYFVVALQPGRDFDQWKTRSEATATASAPTSSFQQARGSLRSAAIVLRNALAAGLLGAALTIVASRLSDTQFPVKVSVNDFWGALTIGFISYFIGGRLLATIIDRFAPPSKDQSGNAAVAGDPAVGKSGGGTTVANQPAVPAAETAAVSDADPIDADADPAETVTEGQVLKS